MDLGTLHQQNPPSDNTNPPKPDEVEEKKATPSEETTIPADNNIPINFKPKSPPPGAAQPQPNPAPSASTTSQTDSDTPSSASLPINHPPASEQADFGVGKPNIGVELEEKPKTPVIDDVSPAPSQPQTSTPAPGPTAVPPLSDSVVSVAPPPSGEIPKPQNDDGVAIPINTYHKPAAAPASNPTPPKPPVAEFSRPAAPTAASSNFSKVPLPPVKASSAATVALVAFLAVLALGIGSAGGFFGFKYLDRVKTSADEASPSATGTATTSATSTPAASPSGALASWKEYASTKYGFSLRYPNTWYSSTSDPQANSLVFASNQESLEGTPTGYKIAVDFQDNDGKTLKAWVDANSVTSGETKTAQEITVSGSSAYQQELSKTGQALATYVPLTDKIIILTYSAPTSQYSSGLDYYTKLIGSVKVNQ